MKIDVHIHTVFSRDGFINLKQAVLRAKQTGIDCFAVTDHNNIKCHAFAKSISKQHDFPIILGSEVKTVSGEILALGINESVKPKMSAEETIDAIHSMGGIAIASHPFSFLLYHQGIGRKITSLKIDAVEAFNARTLIGNGITQNTALKHKLSMVAGSDAHTLSEIGNAYTEVYADTVEGALKQIKKGKTRMYCKNVSFVSVFNWYCMKFKRRLSFG
ncbi:MAG: PHP-associated domain-containing protein [Nanoarchaeota archaeon]|nr:PHP domain-containing protein [Nanoarchaeota archaeon]MBU4299818.1 PHP domain-containing protein [Nanoarchaeota archaeon]MBU4451287.1 PHP domain-containing protein [Nanoarchaeota archaeon]MCG2723576.1 PHP domain-containing protein [archaeon]